MLATESRLLEMVAPGGILCRERPAERVGLELRCLAVVGARPTETGLLGLVDGAEAR